MLERDLSGRGISDENILKAFAEVPREYFVPEFMKPMAYNDSPLPIGKGQTISQPYIIARMLSLAALEKGQKVLEIGTGSGYQTALLCKCAHIVYSVDRIGEFVTKARITLDNIGIHKPHLIIGDGSLGYPEKAPYDRIIVSAAAPSVPRALTDQLADGGILVIPVGGRAGQQLARITRRGDGLVKELFDYCAFVPLIGEEGWEG